MPRTILTEHQRSLMKIEGQLRGALAERKKSQMDIAKKLGKTQPSVSRMLNNVGTIKLDDLVYIADLTGRRVVLEEKGE